MSDVRHRIAELLRANPPAAVAVLVLAVVVLGSVTAAVAGIGPFAEDDGPQPRLDSIEVEAVDVLDRWNETVALRELGDVLPDPVWTRDPDLQLDVSEYVLDTWGVVTLYRHPDERLAAVDLVGAYVTGDDRARMANLAITVVAAISGRPLEEVGPFVGEDLGFSADGGVPSGSAELGDARYTVERSSGSAQLRVTTTSVETPAPANG